MTSPAAHAERAARKVYERLLKQGRSEPAARRDAEEWVRGNLGAEVTLPAPASVSPVVADVFSDFRCPRCGLLFLDILGDGKCWNCE